MVGVGGYGLRLRPKPKARTPNPERETPNAGRGTRNAIGAGSGRLRNVHEGLTNSGIEGGAMHLVQGAYEYCHYMQDRFDDNGW